MYYFWFSERSQVNLTTIFTVTGSKDLRDLRLCRHRLIVDVT